MENHQIIMYLFVSIYIIYSLRVTIKVIRNKYLNRNQKIFNSIATWLIPFIWGIIVLGMVKPVDTTIKKGTKSRSSNTDNWHHLTGGGGFNI